MARRRRCGVNGGMNAPLPTGATAALTASITAQLAAFAARADVAKLLDAATERACVQLYRRGGTRDYLRFGAAPAHSVGAVAATRRDRDHR